MANRLKMAKIDAILQLHQGKWSIRRIARELGVHRESVARQIRLWQQGSKQAGAPIGSEAIIVGAKQATSATQRTTPDVAFVSDLRTGVVEYDSFQTPQPVLQAGGHERRSPLLGGLGSHCRSGPCRGWA